MPADQSIDLTKIDVSGASFEDLKALAEKVATELRRREAAERKKAEKEIIELASRHQIDLGKLKTAPTVPTYADPSHPFRTWAGKGPKPKWLREILATGTSLESLKAKPTE